LLISAMAAAFVVLLCWPNVRDFYEMYLTHESAAWIGAAIATVAGVAAIEMTARVALLSGNGGGSGTTGGG
jgi:hypothetical protein